MITPSAFTPPPARLRWLLCAAALIPCTAPALVVTAPTVTGGSTPHSAPFALANAANNGMQEYALQGQGANTFLEFTFPSAQTFDRVVVINRDSANGSDWIGDFTLTFDGAASTSITRTPLRGMSPIHSLGGSVTATTVRLDVDTVGTNASPTNNTGVIDVIFMNTTAGLTPITGISILGAAPSHASGPFTPDKALDDNVGRSGFFDYASASQGINTYVDFDFGGVRTVRAFDFFDRVADADRVTGFDLIFSQDDVFGNGDDIIRSFTNSGIALSGEIDGIASRYVRYDVTSYNPNSTTHNTGLGEIIFYQAIPEPSVAASLALALGALTARRRRA